jgi:SSS family solute:Na+ symporter
MSLNFLDALVILAYLAGLSWIGIHFSKKQNSREEYYLGRREMHWLLVGGSLLATLVSTVTYLNTPGEMIRYGIGYFASLLVVPLIPPVVNRLIVPVFARLPITSAYEYLEKRYDRRLRTFSAAIFAIRTLVWMGLIIYSASFAVAEMYGWNQYLMVVVMGLGTTLYTTAGGFRTVIWTDNLQLWILFGGALAIPLVIWHATGSGLLGWWTVFQQAGRSKVEIFNWDPTVRVTAVGSMLYYFFWSICTQSSDQVAVQRYLSTPSQQAAQRSMWVFVWFKIALTLCLMICGLALFAFYAARASVPVDAFQQEISRRADKILPQFIAQELPPGISGLILAALMAAAMSSLSSGINSIGSVFSIDLAPRLAFLSGSEASLRADKRVSFAIGVLSCVAAVGVTALVRRTDWNLVELTGRVNMIFVGPMGVLFLVGMLFRRAGTTAGVAGFAGALILSAAIACSRISFLWVIPAPVVAGLAIRYLVIRVRD